MRIKSFTIARQRWATACCLALTATLFIGGRAAAFEMEMGAVTVQDTFTVPAWTNVTFIQAFDSVPLVFALPTTDGGDPATLRIRNVSTTGFEIAQVEPSANDGPHVAMPTAYLAIEPGDHRLPDGTHIAAFEHSTTSFVNRFISNTWDVVGYPSAFGASPAVLASIQTMANESGTPPGTSSVPFMDVAIQNVSTSTMQVSLERAESVAGVVAFSERIGLLVVDNLANVSFVDSLGVAAQLQSLATPVNIQGYSNGCYSNSYAAAFSATPLAVASATSRQGNNGGWLRRCSQSNSALGLTVDEDIDNDSERSHISESAGIVATSVAFHANFDVELTVAKNVVSISDPINGTTEQRSIPEATMGYTISVENRGSISPDPGTVVVSEDVPTDLSLCVSATCQAGGPVVLDTSASPVPPGISLGSVEYSNNGGLSYVYVPIPDATGFDDAVDAIRITLAGTLASIDPAGAPSFELRLAARVD
ncbi:MAG: hypothetical protein ACR2QT_01285 [Woeseiaceae bacterium]